MAKISLKKQKSIAVLCSGGDAPGMNAAIRSVVRFAISRGARVFGVSHGYSGLLEGEIFPMSLASVANIIQRGGTILKTSRCEKFFQKKWRKRAAEILREFKIDGLVVIGGDGSFTGAHLLETETGFPVVGVPGTIDNDIFGSEDTIGFDTAVNTALSSIDKIRDTASSHDRLFLVEVMGRKAGFIAIQAAIGGGAETVVVPEKPQSVAAIKRVIDRGLKRGKRSSIVVVAEGQAGGGAASKIAKELKRSGYSPRVCILGHTQRGGSPTAHDRLLASVMGAGAVQQLLTGRSDVMAVIQNGKPTFISLKHAGKHKTRLTNDVFNLIDALAL